MVTINFPSQFQRKSRTASENYHPILIKIILKTWYYAKAPCTNRESSTEDDALSLIRSGKSAHCTFLSQCPMALDFATFHVLFMVHVVWYCSTYLSTIYVTRETINHISHDIVFWRVSKGWRMNCAWNLTIERGKFCQRFKKVKEMSWFSHFSRCCYCCLVRRESNISVSMLPLRAHISPNNDGLMIKHCAWFLITRAPVFDSGKGTRKAKKWQFSVINDTLNNWQGYDMMTLEKQLWHKCVSLFHKQLLW